MKTLTVTVTADDIAEGEALSCSACPVALAIRRLGYPHARVDWGYAMMRGYDARIELPPAAVKFIEDFDDGRVVHPFVFEFNVP